MRVGMPGASGSVVGKSPPPDSGRTERDLWLAGIPTDPLARNTSIVVAIKSKPAEGE